MITPKIRFVSRLKAGQPQTVVFFGTSLTEGGAWTRQVRAALDAAFPKLVTCVNAGKGGQSSAWGIGAVESAVCDKKPDAVFVEFTTNDAVDRFHIPVAEARKNTERIIDAIKATNRDCDVVLQVMNPVTGRPVGHDGHRGDLPAYWRMYRDLATERGLVLIDHSGAWQAALDQGAENYKKYVPDGLHPNDEGYAKFVTPTILRRLDVPVAPKK